MNTLESVKQCGAVLLITASAASADTLWSTNDDPINYSAGPSQQTDTQFPDNQEVADDFNVNGSIEMVTMYGNGCGNCTPPDVEGVWVRFWEHLDGNPGALQAEYYLEAGDPNFGYSPSIPSQLNITLPQAFEASGWHFISVQMDFGTGGGYWSVWEANYFSPVGATVRFRDLLGTGEWGPYMQLGQPANADLRFKLFGTPTGLPVVSELSETTIERSGRLIVTGTGFGDAPGALLVGGEEAITVAWSNSRIVGYVPEAAGPGMEQVVVNGTNGDSLGMPIEVMLREPQGRMKWRFETNGDYTLHGAAVGPDGRLFINDEEGMLYALAPNGALLWAVDALQGEQGSGAEGPIAVADDGSVYVAVNPLGQLVYLVGLNSDGTIKWTFAHDALTVQAGPSLGPDGNLYIAFNVGDEDDVFSLTQAGDVRWSVGANPFILEDAAVGTDIVFGPSSGGGEIDQLMFNMDGNGAARNFGFDLDNGAQNFATAVSGINYVFQQFQTQLDANANSGDFYMVEFNSASGWALQSFDPDGSRSWRFDPGIASGGSAPNVGPNGEIYFSWDLSRISAVSPSGSELWRHVDAGTFTGHPVASDSGNLLATIGSDGFGTSGWTKVFDAATGDELWRFDFAIDETENVYADHEPSFSANEGTVYVPASPLGEPPGDSHSYLYALSVTNSADLNGDGVIDGADIAALLAQWETQGTADLNGDGIVNGVDLATLLANWS